MLNKAQSHFCVKSYMLYKSKDFHKEAASIVLVLTAPYQDVCDRLLIGLPASCLLLLPPQLPIATTVNFLPEQIWPSHSTL